MTKNIAFQGTFGANSDLACRNFYAGFETVPCDSFERVFELVASKNADLGMIPLENSYAGRVAEIHHLLHDSNLYIVAEHFVKIEHHLAAIPGTKLNEVEEIYSHPQALMQCKQSLSKLKAKTISYTNTAKAAEFIKQSGDKTKAALCSKLAAELNGLELIQKNLEDDKEENTTIFITISREPFDPDPKQGKVITTMLFAVRNIPGALYKALGGFATNGVNMIKLESYIPGGVSKQAKFFISIEGHPSENKVALALEEVGFFSKSVKVLGVYYADKNRQ
jgi:prephenate dehydratase